MIEGFEIGHHTADSDGWLTGTTVVLARDGAVGGVDVRGGGPGTRETDLLDPRTMIERVHAVVLTGGSAYGLAAADGVMTGLERAGIGFPVGPEPGLRQFPGGHPPSPPVQVVPIVPAAVIFDLHRGGDFGHRPGAEFGLHALAAASPERPESGCVGAGTGAVCGGLKSGFGYAERRLETGISVAAAVVVNAGGSAVDPVTGRLYADRGHQLPTPTETERASLAAAYARTPPSLGTTIGVLLTDAALTKAQAGKLAALGHDGMARAIAPVHSMFDGDTVFGLASGRRPPVDDLRRALAQFNLLLAAAAETFADACLDALYAARGRGRWSGYLELAPSVGQR